MAINRYAYELKDDVSGDDFTIDITAGQVSFTCRFLWAIASQEEYDSFTRTLTKRSATDPLTSGEKYIRDYDWIDYYYSLKDVDLDDYLNTSTFLPNSIRQASNPLLLLQEYIQEADTLYEQYTTYQEMLRWQCQITFNDEVVVTNVTPGGWVDYGMPFAFRFTAGSRDSIGKDDLQYVTMEFDIYE